MTDKIFQKQHTEFLVRKAGFQAQFQSSLGPFMWDLGDSSCAPGLNVFDVASAPLHVVFPWVSLVCPVAFTFLVFRWVMEAGFCIHTDTGLLCTQNSRWDDCWTTTPLLRMDRRKLHRFVLVVARVLFQSVLFPGKQITPASAIPLRQMPQPKEHRRLLKNW